MAAGVEIERSRLAHQLHTGFGGCLVSFLTVARMAAGYQVLPRGQPTTRTWNHMIKREFSGGEHERAVLAGVAVAQQDVLAGERARLVRDAAIFQQTNY